MFFNLVVLNMLCGKLELFKELVKKVNDILFETDLKRKLTNKLKQME